jgi:hypothetical protein
MISNNVMGRAALTAILVASVSVSVGQSAVAQTPSLLAPEALSWHGDLTTPDISGVWVRSDTGAASKTDSKEGWQPWPAPLKGKYAALYKQRVTAAAAGKRNDDPISFCLPPGMPRYMSGTNTALLIIQTPGRVMLYRDHAPVRRIWLDGRGNPGPDDLEEFFNGNAIGHYEGTDLVTEVIGIKLQPIDSSGVPHSDKLKVAERFHRLDAQTLSVEITLTDSDAYTRPMKSTVIYKSFNSGLWEPKEFICTPETSFHPDFYVQ